MRNEYSIEEGLEELLGDIGSRSDFIIPIARRGIRILELSPSSQTLFDENKVLFYDAVKFHAKELKNKKLILFDEAVNKGKQLNKLKVNLQKFSIKNGLNFDKKIFTAALLVNRDAEYYPDYYSKNMLLSNNLYDYLSDELHYKILSTGKPMDVDHLIVKIRLPLELIPDFISILHEDYNARELGHSGMYDDVKMFSIDFNLPSTQCPFSFKIPNIKGFSKLFDGGPKKIRVFLKDNVIYIVPIVYPAMEINNNISKLIKTCPLSDKIGNRALCNVLSENAAVIEKYPALQSSVCYNCIVNELNVDLVSNFLIKLKQQIDLDGIEVDDKSIQVVSHYESKGVVKALEEKIKSSMENNEFITSIDGDIAEKCEFKGVSFDREISTITGDYIKLELIEDDESYEIGLRPEIEISSAVQRNIEVNRPLLKHDESSSLEAVSKGLSYYQIKEMMGGMDDLRFSEGMDVALDTGYLKPVTPFEGIKVFCEGEYHQAIVRLYSVASEDVGKSLSCFLSSITPKR